MNSEIKQGKKLSEKKEMTASYTILIEKFNKKYTVSPKYIELVKSKANTLGLKYLVEVIEN